MIVPDIVQFVDAVGDVASAADAFGRTVSNGWGTADSGQVWSTSGGSASDYSVSSGRGRHAMGSLNVSRWTILPVSARDVTVTGSAATDVLATGGSHFLHVAARFVDVNNCYMARVEYTTTQQVILTLRARVAGTDTVLGTLTTAVTHAANALIACKLQVSGSTVRAKAWLASGSEPAAWQLQVADFSLTAPGGVGVRSLLSASNTNTLPVGASWDDVTVAGSANLRLDLNDDTYWGVNYDGTDFSPPNLRRAISQTLLSDGATVTAAAYDNRVVRLRLDLVDSSPDAVATRMQLLRRELNRPTNILRWQPGTSAPQFFQTMRSSINRVTEVPGPGTLKQIDVEVLAGPHLLGLREDLPQATVSADPAAGSNGCFFDLSGIRGDVETPLYLSVASASNPNLVASDPGSSRVSAIAVRRRGTPSATPFLLQAESMTAGADTTVQANQSVMSGSGSNFTRTTFATIVTMQDRLTIATWPASASVDVRGTYRVFMRYRQTSASGSPIQVRLRWGTGSLYFTNDTVSVVQFDGGAGGPYLKYADLGIVQFPQGYDPVTDGPDGVELPVEGMAFALQAARTSGIASLDVDCLLFVPADDRLLLATWPASPSLPVTLTLDSERGQVYTEGTSGVLGRTGAQLAGGPPLVSPGVTNRITFVRDVGTLSSTGGGYQGDDITASTVLTPYYWPRYLYARPPSS